MMISRTDCLNSIPRDDGFFMPAEYARHKGTIMVWPERPGSWPDKAVAARRAFSDIIRKLAKHEKVYLAVSETSRGSAVSMLGDLENVEIVEIATDDAWARDIAPTFVTDKKGRVRAINWSFNAWGGEYNGLYASWEKDDAFAKAIADKLSYEVYDAAPFVLEGGSIHSDGEGTVIVTESCLLSMGRNPVLSKQEIEEKLKQYLGCEKVIWLPYGIYNDETDEHVDNVCCFVGPAKVVLAWTDDENDPQYKMSKEDLDILENEVDAKGRRLSVTKLPIPDNAICVTKEDLLGYEFEEGEDVREIGERLAASYVNFYVANDVVLLPAFGGDNKQSDDRARDILKELFPDRRVCQIAARDILLGGGNIHCITQQIPCSNDAG